MKPTSTDSRYVIVGRCAKCWDTCRSRLVFYPELTVRETLHYFVHLKGAAKARADELLALVGMSAHSKTRVRGLSGGMKQRRYFETII